MEQTKRKTLRDVLKDLNFFGTESTVSLSKELIESQERANKIMNSSNTPANDTSSSRRVAGGRKKVGIVEQVDVNNIQFSEDMIKTYNKVKNGGKELEQ